MVFALVIETAGPAIERTFGSRLGHLATAPPTWGIDLSQYTDFPIWYIRLHGLNGSAGRLYAVDGPVWSVALSVDQVRDLDLDQHVIISGCCYALESDFPKAFLDAGASAFIGGSGYNYAAASDRTIGADTLAKWVTKGLSNGLTIGAAFSLARMRLLLTSWRMADRDARQFELIERSQT